LALELIKHLMNMEHNALVILESAGRGYKPKGRAWVRDYVHKTVVLVLDDVHKAYPAVADRPRWSIIHQDLTDGVEELTRGFGLSTPFYVLATVLADRTELDRIGLDTPLWKSFHPLPLRPLQPRDKVHLLDQIASSQEKAIDPEATRYLVQESNGSYRGIIYPVWEEWKNKERISLADLKGYSCTADDWVRVYVQYISPHKERQLVLEALDLLKATQLVAHEILVIELARTLWRKDTHWIGRIPPLRWWLDTRRGSRLREAIRNLKDWGLGEYMPAVREPGILTGILTIPPSYLASLRAKGHLVASEEQFRKDFTAAVSKALLSLSRSPFRREALVLLHTYAYYLTTYLEAHEEAALILRAIRDGFEHSSRYWCTSAIVHERMGHLRQAVNASRRATAANKGDPAAWRTYGRALEKYAASLPDDGARQEAYARAVEAHQSAVDLDPSSSSLRESLAIALVNARRDDEAVELWRLMRSRSELDSNSHWGYATSLSHLADRKPREEAIPLRLEAIAQLEPLVETEPIDLSVNLYSVKRLLGLDYWRSHQPEKAIPLLAELVEANPHDLTVIRALGFCYSSAGQNENAIRIFEDYIQALGFSSSHLGQPQKAIPIEEFSDLAAKEIKEKQLAGVRRALAINYSFTNQFGKAIPLLEEVLSISEYQNDAFLWEVLCVARRKLASEKGRPPIDALDACIRAEELDRLRRPEDRDHSIPYSLGKVYFELGQFGQAVDAFSRAIDLKSDHAKALNARGEAKFNSGPAEHTAALDDFEKARDCVTSADHDTCISIWRNLETTYQALGKVEQRVKASAKLAELQKDPPRSMVE